MATMQRSLCLMAYDLTNAGQTSIALCYPDILSVFKRKRYQLCHGDSDG